MKQKIELKWKAEKKEGRKEVRTHRRQRGEKEATTS